MTISNATVKYQYAGNGVTTTFAYANVFFAPGDLLVMLSTPTGLVNPQPVLNGGATYDYTIVGTLDAATGEYLAGANVVFNNAPPAGDEITIKLALAFTQSVALIDGGKFPAASVNAELDRLTLLCAQLLEQLTRAIGAPAYDVAPVMALPPAVTRALKDCGFDASGNVAVAAPGAIP